MVVRRLLFTAVAVTLGTSASAAAQSNAGAGTNPAPAPCIASVSGVNCAVSITVRADDTESLIRPLASISLTDRELHVLGTSTADWIAFAVRSAGTSIGEPRVYIDGVPARGVLPSHAVQRITVNGDPFSAEFGGVNQLRVDIDSRPPDRRWRFNWSPPAVGAGGASPLASASPPRSRTLTGGVAGPVPRLPLTFLVDVAHRADSRVPLFADTGSGWISPQPGVLVSSQSSSALAGATWSTPSARAGFQLSLSRSRSENSGIGGINAASTAQLLENHDYYLQSSWRIARRVVHRGSLTFLHRTERSRAPADAPLVVITGQAARGRNEVTSADFSSATLTLKHVVEGAKAQRSWKLGMEVDHSVVTDRREWNPHGRLQLASSTASTGVLFTVQGTSNVDAAAARGALFAEHTLWQWRRGTLRAGARTEWQDGDGFLVAPRLAAGTRIAGFHFTGGAGLFVQPWVPETFAIGAQRSSGADFRVVSDAGVDRVGLVDRASGLRLNTRIAPSYTRRREGTVRAGVQRRAGPWQLGIEETWTIGSNLAGAVRLRESDGLADVVDSDRRLDRRQTHVRVSMNRGNQSLTVKYEHAQSMDDTDGAFAFPAVQGRVDSEWAPSAGIARHTVAATATMKLPAAIRAIVTYDVRAGARFNAVSGEDDEGLGLFTSRGGLARNAGFLRSTRNLSIYASRNVRIARLRGLAFDVGVKGENLTDRLNVQSVGRVIGSPLFGRPLAAAPGRSVRFWVAFGR
jgi:hypothetical protein